MIVIYALNWFIFLSKTKFNLPSLIKIAISQLNKTLKIERVPNSLFKKKINKKIAISKRNIQRTNVENHVKPYQSIVRLYMIILEHNHFNLIIKFNLPIFIEKFQD
ncbi:hypothetical protein BpHYR1_021928 [Brachionus plicatilis]|uniref:Uncharacterized protein n=1 Tax=Brachionus plicatilis TaxID=10195 RepID=A0A3M7PM10_BRAPC|nr:hypothetical protein BpHYR1_021928 [Brachionus plicatilis]